MNCDRGIGLGRSFGITLRPQILKSRMINDNSLPIACSLNDADFQQRRASILAEVRAQVLEVKELDDGYAYRFPSDKAWIAELATFMTFERACCPFLQFNLRLEPNEGPIWLELTGPSGTRAFLDSILPGKPETC